MESKEKLKAIEEFLKTSWCIDGECSSLDSDEVEKFKLEPHKGLTFKLNDSLRGEFYITLYTK